MCPFLVASRVALPFLTLASVGQEKGKAFGVVLCSCFNEEMLSGSGTTDHTAALTLWPPLVTRRQSLPLLTTKPRP